MKNVKGPLKKNLEFNLYFSHECKKNCIYDLEYLDHKLKVDTLKPHTF